MFLIEIIWEQGRAEDEEGPGGSHCPERTGAGHRHVPLAPPVLAQLLPGQSTPKMKLWQKAGGWRRLRSEGGSAHTLSSLATMGGKKTAAARSF